LTGVEAFALPAAALGAALVSVFRVAAAAEPDLELFDLDAVTGFFDDAMTGHSYIAPGWTPGRRREQIRNSPMERRATTAEASAQGRMAFTAITRLLSRIHELS
jgi:hypothetical protein